MANENGNGTAQGSGNDNGQGQGQNQNQNTESQNHQTQGSGQQSGQSTENDELAKEVAGLRELMGKWSNEIGSNRELKDQLAALEARLEKTGNGQNGQSNQNNANDKSQTQTPKVDPLTTIIPQEREAIAQGWKNLPQEERTKLWTQAEGDTPQEKQQSIQRMYLNEIRNNAPVIPDDILGDTASGTEDSNKSSQQTETTASIIRSLRSGSRKASRSRTGTDQANGTGQPSQGGASRAPVRGGGLMERLSQ